MMNRDIVIVGHGGLAREVAFLLQEIEREKPTWTVRGYVTSAPAKVGQQVGRHRIFATDDWLVHTAERVACVLAIGDHRVVTSLYLRFRANANLSFPSLVHPSATGDWSRINLGDGNIILNGACITTDVSLGAFNIVNPGCSLSHDCVLGSHNLLGPGVHLGGGAIVGNRVLLGVGAAVLPGVSIVDDVVVGGGSVVVRDITRAGTYMGVPARGAGPHQTL